ncbi:MAG: hypothetical protein EZS26_004071 [Candidatus Ordinivivax streblomastigis]|uniref:Uncharacterized protein n=1 Tax=Candidatus Ordinivivax streblomastigis TaxID=2540710 RepID=A0A5M8NRK6_9BACT|nr:MAG: hypothetical protein EZS26_004071 [Candidatus Ordinivivax streblomastigis]
MRYFIYQRITTYQNFSYFYSLNEVYSLTHQMKIQNRYEQVKDVQNVTVLCGIMSHGRLCPRNG